MPLPVGAGPSYAKAADLKAQPAEDWNSPDPEDASEPSRPKRPPLVRPGPDETLVSFLGGVVEMRRFVPGRYTSAPPRAIVGTGYFELAYSNPETGVFTYVWVAARP